MAETSRSFSNGFLLGISLGILIGGLAGYVAYDILAPRQITQRTEFDACIEQCKNSGRTSWKTPDGREMDCFAACAVAIGVRR